MTFNIIGSKVHTTDYLSAALQIVSWAKSAESRIVCAANVHMLMEAWDDSEFRNIINYADIVAPDGMPLVWMLRLKGFRNQSRVYGPTLMLQVLELASSNHIPVGFYGGKPEVPAILVNQMLDKYPNLNVVYSFSPPFRALTTQENKEICQDIKKSGLRILFVGLGCPKQERWMAEHRDQIPAVMLGVGAAFDIHAGQKSQAPGWMQSSGLEWLFRFLQEPDRLWKRYLIHNSRFLILAVKEFLGILKVPGSKY